MATNRIESVIQEANFEPLLEGYEVAEAVPLRGEFVAEAVPLEKEFTNKGGVLISESIEGFSPVNREIQALYGVRPAPTSRPIQAMYGVVYPTPTVTNIQPLYGVVYPTRPINQPISQPLYGVIHPIHDVPDINLTYDQIVDNVNTLRSSADKMRSDWNLIKNEVLTGISQSWAGSDCNAYINKIKKMDNKMENSFKALDLLASTYEKAKDEVEQNQITIKSMIDSL